ncbi:MAG: hypothetical protein SF051_10675 [Elusimicrobiota bacterium]|nr:hypothetical protein [Elusimicrobiota bacterium]
MTRAAALLLLLVAGPAAAADYTLPEPPPGPRVDYEADEADFDADKSLLHLKGAVRLKESTWTVKAEELWVDTAHRSARTDGPMLVEDGWSALYGESGEFDFERHSGRLFTTSAGHGDWRIRAKQARMHEDRTLDYRAADFTSCSALEPHYHFRASRITVKPRKSLVARNVFFYLGEVPVFYTPILYKSLKKQHFLRWKTSPGYDNRNGPFARNTLTTEHGRTVYSKLFADYYASQGFGYGGELFRRDGDDSRGALYGYRIKETSTRDERWTVLGQQYQALTSSMSFQGRLQFQSDADFNNHYARSNTFRVTPELINGAAVVHRFSKATARLSYSRLDRAALDRRTFVKETESAPRLDLQSTPLRLWRLPWLNTLDGFADNEYDRSRSYLEKSVGAGWEGTRTFNLARGVSLAPKLLYRQTYFNRYERSVVGSTQTVLDAAVGRYGGEAVVRLDTPLGGVDAGYRQVRRQRPGHLDDDSGAVDKGVEENLVTLSDVFFPAPRTWARLSSGYDFRTFRDRAVGFRRRVLPIVAEASWNPSDALNLTFRNDYQLEEGQRAVLFDARWGDETGPSLGGGFAYNLSDPSRYVASAEVGLAPSSPTWRVSFGLRAVAETPGGAGRLHGARVFEKEFGWTRRWHDFYTKVAGRFRPGGVGEASIRIDLKFGSADPKSAPRRDWESELFPERATRDELRP